MNRRGVNVSGHTLQVYEGFVIKVDEEKFTFDMDCFDGTALYNVMLPSNGGYSMPKVGDSVISFLGPATGKAIMWMKSPSITIDGGSSGTDSTAGGLGGNQLGNALPGRMTVRNIAPTSQFNLKGTRGNIGTQVDENTTKMLTGDFNHVRDVIGPDKHGASANQRFPIEEGSHAIFDVEGGAHGYATNSGDVFFVYSDVNQMHFIKDNDQFKQFFRRGWTKWPGGKIRVGDFRATDPSQREEDLDLELQTTTMNKKKIRWRYQYGHNITDAPDDEQSGGSGVGGGATANRDVVERSQNWVGVPQGKNFTEKLIFQGERKKGLEGKFEWKRLQGNNTKKLMTGDVLFTDQNKIKLNIFNNDQEKTKIEIDISSGDINIELVKGNLHVKSQGTTMIESTGNAELKSSGDTTVRASGTVTITGSAINIG